MRVFQLVLALVLGACQTPAPDLATQLDAELRSFRGTAGIYVRHIATGEEVAIRADELFPTASMIKVPILLALFDRVERGELDYHMKLTWDKKRIYPGDDLLAKLENGQRISLPKLVLLMLTFSDNTASLWLQELAGTGTRINAWLAAHGFSATRVNSRTPGRRKDKEQYGWGQTSPREMAQLLVEIRNGRGFSKGAADEMYRNLTRTFWNDTALARVPPWVQVASKQGAVSDSRSEVFLVNAPHGDYVCCVITKDQADTSWKHTNAGFALIRNVSRILWHHFEPESKWNPPDDEERW